MPHSSLRTLSFPFPSYLTLAFSSHPTLTLPLTFPCTRYSYPSSHLSLHILPPPFPLLSYYSLLTSFPNTSLHTLPLLPFPSPFPSHPTLTPSRLILSSPLPSSSQNLPTSPLHCRFTPWHLPSPHTLAFARPPSHSRPSLHSPNPPTSLLHSRFIPRPCKPPDIDPDL